MHHNDQLQDKLTTYLEDAYAMENQIAEQLEKQAGDTQKFPSIQSRIRQHLEATKQHRTRMEERLSAYNKRPSSMKGAMTNLMGNLMGAVSGTRTDALAKTARDDYMIEHMEIAAYELLITTAQACGDVETVRAAEANLRDEVEMANWLEQNLPEAAILSLQEEGVNIPQQDIQLAQTAAIQALLTARSALPQMSDFQQTASPAGTI
jgi:ferritin-like metal-binding protein YciE